jgi:2,4-diketo-3-deoxy-L-fuconate hydrolase
MKLATYASKGQQYIGAVVADDKIVIDLAAADKALARREKRPSHPFLADMLSLLDAGNKGLSAAKNAAAAAAEKLGDAPKPDGKTSHLLSRVKLKAPVPNPRKIFCLAGNYQDHIEEGGGKMAVQDKETPRVFMKPPTSTVISPGDSILIPPIARSIDWEGELAVVMGRNAKGVKAKDALKYVAGYTVMNDVSERDLLIKNRTESRPQDKWFDWLNGKWLDTFAPQGPWIVTKDDIPDPQVLDISTYINGERKQHNNTGQMLYKVAQVIEYISAIITLEPGDLISTGTVSGVGSTTGTFLQPGDKVEIEISQIGVLRNKVAASKK